MSTVTPSPSTRPVGAASSVSSLTSAADQEDRFMKLLVAQMKNQDPLNPLDNAQMTSQIAQINTVGGLEKLNRTVESLLSAFGGLQAQSALQLAGREVLVDGHKLTLDADGATGGVLLGAAADQVQVEVLDATGSVVHRLALGASPAGARSFVWDGRLADGNTAAPGEYRIRTAATAAGKAVDATPLAAAGVRAVTQGDGGTLLDLGPAGVKPLGAVRSYL